MASAHFAKSIPVKASTIFILLRYLRLAQLLGDEAVEAVGDRPLRPQLDNLLLEVLMRPRLRLDPVPERRLEDVLMERGEDIGPAQSHSTADIELSTRTSTWTPS